MKENLLDVLMCPICHSSEMELMVHARDAREIREGDLLCERCGTTFRVHKGIVHMLVNPSCEVKAEAQGWVEMLDTPEKEHEFRDEWILALPFIKPSQSPDQESVEIWNRVGKHFSANLDRLDLGGGGAVLEIGASRCWGVAELARRGVYAIGLDILTHKYIGLETADIWLEATDLYFERVLGDMHDLPFKSDSLDLVVTTSSLHHTARLDVALSEIYRVLKPNGQAFFINEPVIPDGQPKPDLSNSAEIHHNIIESRPTYSEWIFHFERTGFEIVSIQLVDDMHALLRKRDGPASFLAKLRTTARLKILPMAQRVPPGFWRFYDRVKAMLRSGR